MSTEAPATVPTAEEAAVTARPADTQPATAAKEPDTKAAVKNPSPGGLPPLPSFVSELANFIAKTKGPRLFSVIWGPEKGECQQAVVRAENVQEAAKVIRDGGLASPDGETIHVQVYGFIADHYELV